jgi:hypothetical protein
MTDVHCYGEFSDGGDDHRCIFSVPHPSGKGRILKAQTFTVENSSGHVFALTEHYADDETTVVLGVFDDDKVEAVAHKLLGKTEHSMIEPIKT